MLKATTKQLLNKDRVISQKAPSRFTTFLQFEEVRTAQTGRENIQQETLP